MSEQFKAASVNQSATLGAGPAVAQTLVRLHHKLGGDPAAHPSIQFAAIELWQAMLAGDVCLPLADLTDQDRTHREHLERSPIVLVFSEPASSQGGQIDGQGKDDVEPLTLDAEPVCPLVLAHEHLYTYRYWQAEQALARSLLQRASQKGDMDAPVPHEFAGASPSAAQQQAVKMAAQRRLLILTGGPGTGKSYTLAAIVRAAVQRASHRASSLAEPNSELLDKATSTGASTPPFAIAVAAPTGKATARLADALRGVLTHNDNDSNSSRSRVTLQAMTLHRLLGYQGSTGSTVAPMRLPFDLVVIDECSMVDTLLAQRLMAGLSEQTSLVLAGDRDQLASVQAGAFFSAICTSESSVIEQCRVVLAENFRQTAAPEIVQWAQAVRRGHLSLQELPSAGAQIVFESGGAGAMVEQIVQRLRPLLEQARHIKSGSIAGLHAQFQKVQALSLLRAGPLGVDAINAAVSARLNPGQSRAVGSRWYAGRLVVVRRNATHRSLFNGDIGLCVELVTDEPISAPAQLRVAFVDTDSNVRLVLPSQMPLHEDAWALTVHQAQGSDFDAVLLMPAPPEHPLASREGLYTALTRARLKVHIFGSPQDLVSAALAPANRRSGLLKALDS